MRTIRRRTGARVWLWRWRRNPLRRRSDRVEAWILLGSWLLALLAGVLAGRMTAASVDHALAARRAETHTVSAVLTKDADRQVESDYSDGGVWAKVRWSNPDGTTRTALTRVEPGLKAGAPVTVWTDRAGALVPRPATEGQTRVEASLVGGLGGLSAAGGVLFCGRLVRARLDRQRMQAWDQEWEQVGPRWRRTTG
ncbi:Rv1733c family protein [Streptomyces sp. NPDC001020]